MILIAFGANLDSPHGPPSQTFEKLLDALQEKSVKVLDVSRLWQTKPVPYDSTQPDYLNAVLSVQTSLRPEALLEALLEVEQGFGRARAEDSSGDVVRNQARSLDLDILDYNQETIRTHCLTLPHPRMHERAFVLFPLQDIAPEWVHPELHMSIDDMMSDLDLSQEAVVYKE